MNSSMFNENMTHNEARTILFRSVEGKSKAEIETIINEYSKVLPAILNREQKLASEGWMFGQ